MSNKQTSIEWLLRELYNNDIPYYFLEVIQEAKEMHKQEIIDAYYKGEFNDGMNESAEQYYTENYTEFNVNKGSDNTPKEVKKDSFGEISDEEIEKFADEELGTIRTDFDFGVIQGMKWYREQLKKL
jgi:hypothetical protein